jgi:NitT/TauT family transport system permease protein
VIPAVRPLTAFVSKLRFLGLTGLLFPFTLATGGGFALKVALLTFGMTTFLVTALTRIVDESGASHQVDFVRSLGASRARVIYEALILGPLDRSLDAIRQNVAMGWSMITMVEGIARSDGGVGAMLLTQNKHFRLAEVYAVLVVVLLVGLAIDQAMAMLGHVLCPHTRKEVTS